MTHSHEPRKHTRHTAKHTPAHQSTSAQSAKAHTSILVGMTVDSGVDITAVDMHDSSKSVTPTEGPLCNIYVACSSYCSVGSYLPCAHPQQATAVL